MRIILLSGGSGKRLWPLSGEVRSKAFLKLLPGPDGSRESMIQRVCRQLGEAGLLGSTAIVTHHSQLELVRSQIGNLIPILTEPYKRGTLTAIALACTYLKSQPDADLNEPLIFMPVDPFVEASFFELLRTLPSVLSSSGADIALVGTRPACASTQYGYIVPEAAGTDKADGYYRVTRFAEKPDMTQARRLLEKGALWNCGVFAFSLEFISKALLEFGLPEDNGQLVQIYEGLSEASFDKEIVEHTKNTVVVPYEGAWEDLGSWDTFTKHLGTESIGPGSISDDSRHTHLVSELDQPIHVIGVSNLIIAASPDGILVASKENSSRIKELDPGRSILPSTTEYSWGRVKILRRSGPSEAPDEIISTVRVLQGEQLREPGRPGWKGIWMILSGSGQVTIDDCPPRAVKSGDVLEIKSGTPCSLVADTELEFVSVQLKGARD
ncbi:sugar phosphate nucleotidyltransferase [Paenibacillus sp. YPG26]|uniref:sugar phosphate nucleotidyltransferase n=1 Tax=Paenibacillus sp. YPG26 TaxID=2878915 RepID=UPI00203C6C23|nr:sugar phosphate nucleotidyltransferase [Paenibacillus sp. YPG26]USB33780.1 NTP transferase domain-containing protein [Paenibacillus sp. YPG26]